MDLILHPGHSKCGSSSIQYWLFQNREKLEAQGIYIPDKKFHFSFEGNADYTDPVPPVGYFLNFLEKGDFLVVENRLTQIVEKGKAVGAKKIVLSVENLTGNPARGVYEILNRYFEKIQVLYYIRRQDDFLLSAWQQWGYKKGLQLEAYVKRLSEKGRPPYLNTVQNLESVFGKDSLTVIPFHKKAFESGDLVYDFLQRVGLEGFYEKRISISENVGLNPIICEFLVKYSALFENMHDDRLKKRLTQLSIDYPWITKTPKSYFSESERQKVMSLFEEENKRLLQYFPKFTFEEIFGNRKFDDGDLIEESKKGLQSIAPLIETILKENQSAKSLWKRLWKS